MFTRTNAIEPASASVQRLREDFLAYFAKAGSILEEEKPDRHAQQELEGARKRTLVEKRGGGQAGIVFDERGDVVQVAEDHGACDHPDGAEDPIFPACAPFIESEREDQVKEQLDRDRPRDFVESPGHLPKRNPRLNHQKIGECHKRCRPIPFEGQEFRVRNECEPECHDHCQGMQRPDPGDARPVEPGRALDAVQALVAVVENKAAQNEEEADGLLAPEDPLCVFGNSEIAAEWKSTIPKAAKNLSEVSAGSAGRRILAVDVVLVAGCVSKVDGLVELSAWRGSELDR